MNFLEYLPMARQFKMALYGLEYTEQTTTSQYPETKGLKFTRFVLDDNEVQKIYDLTESDPTTVVDEVFAAFFGRGFGTVDIISPPVMAVILVYAPMAYKVRETLKRENFRRIGLN